MELPELLGRADAALTSFCVDTEKGDASVGCMAALVGAALLAGGSTNGPELVMSPGCEITARTQVGEITIQAGKVIPPGKDRKVKTSQGVVTIRATERYERTYSWGGCRRTTDLGPRNQRWNGSLGIYSPGTGFHWRECEGVARAAVEEGQQHFATVDEAMDWLKARAESMPYAYRNDGLAVGWRTVIPDRKQLEVHVWQIFIDGKKPRSLPGAADNSITSNCP
jgi:hypothetical protein